MTIIVLAFLLGVVAGLRSMTAPAAVSWAAVGWLHLENTWAAFLGYTYTPYILTALAIGEWINDKLPKTPSRKSLVPFVARIASGTLCGAAIGTAHQAFAPGLIAGVAGAVAGAVAGTLGGYEARTRLVKATGGKDFRIALAEDAVAIVAAVILVHAL